MFVCLRESVGAAAFACTARAERESSGGDRAHTPTKAAKTHLRVHEQRLAATAHQVVVRAGRYACFFCCRERDAAFGLPLTTARLSLARLRARGNAVRCVMKLSFDCKSAWACRTQPAAVREKAMVAVGACRALLPSLHTHQTASADSTAALGATCCRANCLPLCPLCVLSLLASVRKAKDGRFECLCVSSERARKGDAVWSVQMRELEALLSVECVLARAEGLAALKASRPDVQTQGFAAKPRSKTH